MKSCEEIEQLISCMIDGESSESEAAEVQKHIESCEQCKAFYTAVRTISEDFSDDLMTPPENFASGVMAKISNQKPKQKGKIITFRRFVATAAACLVLAVGVMTVPDFVMNHTPRMDSSKSSPYEATPESALAENEIFYMSDFAANSAGAADSSTQNTETDIVYFPEPQIEGNAGEAADISNVVYVLEYNGEGSDSRMAAGNIAMFDSAKISELQQLLSPAEATEKPEATADFIISDAFGAETLLWLTQSGVICERDNEVYFAAGTAEEILQIIK